MEVRSPHIAMGSSVTEHITRRVPIVTPTQTAAVVREQLVQSHFECASHIVVCDQEKFLGIVRIEDLLAARPEVRVENLMDRNAPTVGPEVDQEIAAWWAVQKGESALTVVDQNGTFIGVIPPDRLVSVLLSEHEEDLSRLGGFTTSTAAARASSEEPVQRRFRHRVPWLLIGLGGALLSAHFVGLFEGALREIVMLAFFLPGIVYLADAVGTQTETIVVRGLSVGVSMRKMLWPELMSGLAIGLSLAIIAGPLVWWWWGSYEVGLCIGLSVFAACSTATLAAMALPAALNAFGFDPAYGSGPLATVVQDLLSILIYFLIAGAVVT